MAKFIILCLGLLASAANVNILRSYEGFQVPDDVETVISLGSKVESEWSTVSFSFFMYAGSGVSNREKILKVRDREGNELGAIYRSGDKVDIEWSTDQNAKDECDADASVLMISLGINRSEWSFIGFTVNPGDKLLQGFYANSASTYPFLSKTTLEIAPLIFPTISPDHILAFGPISAKDTILTSFNLHDFAFCVDNFMGLLYFEHLGVLKMTKDYSFSMIEKYFLNTPLTTLQSDLGELIIEPSETVYNLYQPDLPLDQVAVSFDYTYQDTDFYSFDLYLDVISVEDIEYVEADRVLDYQEDNVLGNNLDQDRSVYCGEGIFDFTVDGFNFKYIAENENKIHKISIFEYSDTYSSIGRKSEIQLIPYGIDPPNNLAQTMLDYSYQLPVYDQLSDDQKAITSFEIIDCTGCNANDNSENFVSINNAGFLSILRPLGDLSFTIRLSIGSYSFLSRNTLNIQADIHPPSISKFTSVFTGLNQLLVLDIDYSDASYGNTWWYAHTLSITTSRDVELESLGLYVSNTPEYDRRIAWIPTTPMRLLLTVSMTNAGGKSFTYNEMIYANTLPVLDSIENFDTYNGCKFKYYISASDADGDTISYSFTVDKNLAESQITGNLLELTTEEEDLQITISISDESEDYVGDSLEKKVISTSFQLNYANIAPVMTSSKQYCYKNSICVTHFIEKVTVHNPATAKFSLLDPSSITNIGHFGYFTATSAQTIHTSLNIIEENSCHFCSAFTLLIGDEYEIDPIPTIFYQSGTPLEIYPSVYLKGLKMSRVEAANIVANPKVIRFSADDVRFYWSLPVKTSSPGLVKVRLTNSVPVALGSFYFYVIVDNPRTLVREFESSELVAEYGKKWNADISKLISGDMDDDKKLLYYEITAGSITDISGRMKWIPDSDTSFRVDIYDPRHFIDSHASTLTNGAISWVLSYSFSLSLSYTPIFSSINPDSLIIWADDMTTVSISLTHYSHSSISILSNPKSLTMVDNESGTLRFTWSSSSATTSGRIVLQATDNQRSEFRSSTEFEIYVKSDIAPEFESDLNDKDKECIVGQSWSADFNKYVRFYDYIYGENSFSIESTEPDISDDLRLRDFTVDWISPNSDNEQRITVKACHYKACAVHTYSLQCLYPIYILTIPEASVSQGATYSHTVSLTYQQQPLPLISLSQLWLSNAPDQMSISISTGEITWSLLENEPISEHQITVHAVHSTGVSSSQTFHLTVTSNHSPSLSLNEGGPSHLACIVSEPTTDCSISISEVFSIQDLDSGETFTYSISSENSDPSFSISGDSILWNRSSQTSTAPSSMLTLVAYDSQGADSARVSFVIYPNYMPEIGNLYGDSGVDVFTAYKGCEWVGYFNIYDEGKTYPTEASYFVESNIVVSISNGERLDRSRGTLMWTPSDGLSVSSVKITVEYTDSGIPSQNVRREFEISMGVNSLPVCNIPNSARQVFEDTSAWVVDLASYCSDVEEDELRYSISSGPTGLILTGTTLRWNTNINDLGQLYSITILIHEVYKNSNTYYTFTIGMQSKLCIEVTNQVATAHVPFYSYLSVCSSATTSSLDYLTFRMISSTSITINSHGVIFWANPNVSTETISIEIIENNPNYPSQTDTLDITYTVSTSTLLPSFTYNLVSSSPDVTKTEDFEYRIVCTNALPGLSIDMILTSDLSTSIQNNSSSTVSGKLAWSAPHIKSTTLNTVQCTNPNGLLGLYSSVFTPLTDPEIPPTMTATTLLLTQDLQTQSQLPIIDPDTYIQDTEISIDDNESIGDYPGLNVFKWGYIDWTPSQQPVRATVSDGKRVGSLGLKIISDGQTVPVSVEYSLTMVNHQPEIEYIPPVHFDRKIISYTEFEIRASDPDGDTLNYSILSSSDNSFDTTDPSAIKWSPNETTSVSRITFKASDPSGAYASSETIGCQGVVCRSRPIITSISTALGCTNSGSTVQDCEVLSPKDTVSISITGHNFGTSEPEVYVGRRQCKIESYSNRNIVCQLPLTNPATLTVSVFVIRKDGDDEMGYLFDSISYKELNRPVLKDSEFFGRGSVLSPNEAGEYEIPISSENLIDSYTCSVVSVDNGSLIEGEFIFLSNTLSACKVSGLSNGITYYVKICIETQCTTSTSYTFIARNDISIQIDDSNSDIPYITSGHSHGGYYLPIKILNLSPDLCNNNRIYIQFLTYSIQLRNICSSHSGAILLPSVDSFTNIITIRVSINGGLTYSTDSNSIQFIYTGYCTTGQYISNNLCIDCPTGYYCNHAFTRESVILAPRPCTMGTYSDSTASTSCKTCTIGNQCYCTAMSQPEICDAGFICDREGIIKRYKPCESGYFCKEGTISSEKDRNNLIATKPIPCAENTYCLDGVYTSGPIENDLYTPQTCSDSVNCPQATENSLAIPSCQIGYFCPNARSCNILSSWMTGCSCTSEKCTCPKGYYCPHSFLSIPYKCPTGYYQDETGQVECKECPLGYYCPNSDTTSKIVCPPGHECPAKSISPNPCRKGYYSTDGTNTCLPCDAGKICPDIRMVSPLDCPAGQMCSQTGLIYGLDCPAGYFCYPNTNKTPYTPIEDTPDYDPSNADIYPEPCPKGHYCPGNDKQAIPCDINTYADTIGSSSCSDCPDGKLCLLADSSPTICPAGSYCTNGKAYNCPEGNYCPEGSISGTSTPDLTDITGEQCDPGTYCPSGTGYKTPDPAQPKSAQYCAPGTYNDQYGQAVCSSCTAGYKCPNQGTITPTACSAGEYSHSGATECSLCPLGTYQSLTGQSSCSPCPAGKICTSLGMTSGESASLCPAGSYCPGGNAAGISCPPGYYCKEGISSYLDYSCPAGRICSTGTAATDEQIQICNDDTTWISCSIGSACTTGYYCPTGTITPIACPVGYYCNYITILTLQDYLACTSPYYCGSICPKNSYCLLASSLPTPCTPGYLSDPGSDAQDDCKICPVNYYCPSDADSPIACSGGLLSASGSDSESDCMSCPRNYYCVNAGTPVFCGAGKTSDANSDEESDCKVCEKNTYCPSDGSGPLNCNEGYLASPGSVQEADCKQCPKNSYCPPDADAPIACGAGKYSSPGANHISDCLECPADQYCPDDITAPLLCDIGKYSNVGSVDISNCNDCPSNYYCLADGSGPNLCGAGTYSNSGAFECTTCPVDSYCPGGGSGKLECGAGKYSNLGSSSCSDCPVDSYCPGDGSGKRSCGAGKYSAVRSSSILDCEACPVDYYCTGDGTGKISCGPGKYSNLGSSICTICPKDSYCPGNGSGKIACETGEYSDEGSDESSDCNKCPVDSYCPGNETGKLACEAGTYSEEGATVCIPCPNNYYCGADGSGKISCGAGMYSNSNSMSISDCFDCSKDYYCPGDGTGPIPCGAGKYSDARSDDINDCKDCPANKYCPVDGEDPIPCGAGKFSNAGSASLSDCKTCEANYYCPADGSGRSLCVAGTYSDAGASSCIPCPANNYCPGDGTGPSLCSAGTYSTEGASACTPCSDNYYCPGNGSGKIECEAGTYSETGASVCTICPKDSYCPGNGTAKSSCGVGNYSNEGSTSLSDCKTCEANYYCPADGTGRNLCEAGTYSDAGASSCTTCHANYYCPGNGSGKIECEAGTYSDAGASSCTTCPKDSYCPGNGAGKSSCDPGNYSAEGSTSLSDCKTCEANYYCPADGTGRSLCVAGTYSNAGASSCTVCPKDSYCPGNGASKSSCGAGKYSAEGSTSISDCKACEANYYCLADGSGPNVCEPGTYSGEGASSCTICPKDSYCPGNGAGKSSCGAGKYSAEGSTSLSDCKTCEANYYCTADGSGRSLCEAGTYSDAGASSCIPCPANTYCLGDGTSPIICSAGTYSQVGSTACSPCPENSYCPGSGFGPSLCEAGTYSNAGASSCTTCPKDSYCPGYGASKSSCGAGKYSAEGSTSISDCKTCEANYYCPADGSGRSLCVAGTYSNAGASSCTDCPKDSYCPGNGAGKSSCGAGKYSNANSDDISDCITCSKNYYCPGDGTGPIQCDENTYSDSGSDDISDCKNCPPNYYCPADGSGQVLCEAGTYSNAGSVSILDCKNCPSNYYCPADGSGPIVCGAGTYSAEGANSCTPCSANYYCPGNGTGQTLCGAGTYSETGASICTACLANYYCPGNGSGKIECEAGTYSETGASSCTTCPKDSYCPGNGSAKSSCGAGYYSDEGSDSIEKCYSCPPNHYCAGDGTGFKLCEAGTYSTGGASSCSICPKDSYCPGGFSGRSTCGPGKYSEEGSDDFADCNTCIPNYYCPGDGSGAIACGDGKTSNPGSTSETDCTVNIARRAQEVLSSNSTSHSSYTKPLYNLPTLSIPLHPFTHASLISHFPIRLISTPQNLVLSFKSSNFTSSTPISTKQLQVNSSGQKTLLHILSSIPGDLSIKADDSSYSYLLNYLEVQAIDEYYFGFLSIIPPQTRDKFETPSNYRPGNLQISRSNEFPVESISEDISGDIIQDTLPYIGYCSPNYSRFISINSLIFSPECEFSHSNNDLLTTETICSKDFYCKYSENITELDNRKLYWYEALSDTTNYRYKNMQDEAIFYLSRYSANREEYMDYIKEGNYNDDKIGVTVRRIYDGESWQEGLVPQHVKLILGCQYSSDGIEILKASMELSNFYQPKNSYERDYQFEFSVENLSWFERFNLLILETLDYSLVYISIISILFLLQVISLLLSLLYKPASTHTEFLSCFTTQLLSLFKGLALTSIPIAIVLSSLYLIFSYAALNTNTADFNDEVQDSDADTQESIDRELGRFAVCLMTVCAFGLVWCCDMMYLGENKNLEVRKQSWRDSKGSYKFLMIICVVYLVALDHIGCYSVMKYIIPLVVILLESVNYLLSSWFERSVTGLLKLTVLKYILQFGTYIMLFNIPDLSTTLSGLITLSLLRFFKENILSNLNCSSSTFYLLAFGPHQSLQTVSSSTLKELTSRLMPITLSSLACIYLSSLYLLSGYLSIHLNNLIYLTLLQFLCMSWLVEPLLLFFSLWIKQSRDSKFDIPRVYNKCWEDFKNRNSWWGIRNQSEVDEDVSNSERDCYSTGFSYQWYFVVMMGTCSATGMALSVRMMFLANYSPFLDYMWIGLAIISKVYVGYCICKGVKNLCEILERRKRNTRVGMFRDEVKGSVSFAEISFRQSKEFDVKFAYDKSKLDTRERSESPLSKRLTSSILTKVRSSKSSKSLQSEINDCISQHLAPKEAELKAIFKILKKKFPSSPISSSSHFSFSNSPENQTLHIQAANLRKKSSFDSYPSELKFPWNN